MKKKIFCLMLAGLLALSSCGSADGSGADNSGEIASEAQSGGAGGDVNSTADGEDTGSSEDNSTAQSEDAGSDVNSTAESEGAESSEDNSTAESEDAGSSEDNSTAESEDAGSSEDSNESSDGNEENSDSPNVPARDIIFFGTYEQNNVTDDGAEAIEWEVLEVKDGKALVISKYALDCKPYHKIWDNVTWENCELRSWLNNEFYNTAFSEADKAKIQSTLVVNNDNQCYGSEGGNDTEDHVFLLSAEEAVKYFAPDKLGEITTNNNISSEGAAKCKATPYAQANGAYWESSDCVLWWLRSPGNGQKTSVNVNAIGGINLYGYNNYNNDCAIRPAMWISVN